MSNKITGAVFCLISAILFCTRYIAASILMQGVSCDNGDPLYYGLEQVDNRNALIILSLIALIIGLVFLFTGIRKDFQEKNK